ncbi:MAG: hypothetical protein Q8S73_34490 [Deltaproteobacteria bacterium]|nr:hypothetical protein [Myxococcales bacterium]MDP3219259.1 hypothetical protein [Deltaproteobacteria bacterium]
MAMRAINPAPARDLVRGVTVPAHCIARGVRLVLRAPRRERVLFDLPPL